jgi:hypothetical protein
MSIFKKFFGKEDTTELIQCESRDYLVYRWESPKGPRKTEAIPSNSILRVNVGEVAIKFANQLTADSASYIEGPYQNPVGEGVYDVYFINTQGTNQIKFAVPFFDVADPRNIDLMVPVAVRGTVTFCISDYQEFVRMNRLTNLNLSELTAQVKDALIRHIKSIVANIPLQHEIPLVGLESQLGTINDIVKDELVPRFINDFGVNLKALDITDISIDKECEAYATLKSITQDISVQKTKHKAEQDLNISDVEVDLRIKEMKEESAEKIRIQKEETDLQLMDKRKSMEEKHRIQSENADLDLMDKKKTLEEKFKQMREEAELKVNSQQSIIDETRFAMHSRTEEAARSGQILSESSRPKTKDFEAQMAENLKLGISTKKQDGQIKLNQTGMMPPKPVSKTETVYHVANNGQQSGPYTLSQLQQLQEQGLLTPETMVWQKGSPQWSKASSYPELSSLFQTSSEDVPPPLP